MRDPRFWRFVDQFLVNFRAAAAVLDRVFPGGIEIRPAVWRFNRIHHFGGRSDFCATISPSDALALLEPSAADLEALAELAAEEGIAELSSNYEGQLGTIQGFRFITPNKG